MRPGTRFLSLIGLALAAVLVAACSSSAATAGPTTAVPGATSAAGLIIGTGNSSSLGAYLTGQQGMTLYVLTKDSAGTSACYDNCAATWPPLTVASGENVQGPTGATGAFGTITRQGGALQVTYDGRPLYNYSGDSAAGDTNGQGTNGSSRR